MSRLSYIITGSGVTAIIDGETHTITSDNASYREVLDAIIAGEDPSRIADLFRTANAIKRYTKGAVEISADGSTLFYKGEEMNNVVVDRILKFMTAGLPVDPLIAFLERLLANPSKRSIDELYKFLEHESLPITERGTFLAYKGVNDNYTDCHTGTFDNSPGQTHEMARNMVDDDARRSCSNGFHVGSLQYATGFGSRTVIVEVDPADVVSVPYEDANKLRTSKYTVIADFNGALGDPLHDASSPYRD
jgi:hypothetical protein